MYHFYLLESKLKVLMKNKRKYCWDVTLGLSALGSEWVWSAHRKGRKLTQRVNCGRLYYSCIIRSPWMWPGLSYFLLPNRIEQKWWDTTSEVTKNLCFPLCVLSWFFICLQMKSNMSNWNLASTTWKSYRSFRGGTSLVVQWLLHAPNAGGLGLIPGQGTRSSMPHQTSHVLLGRPGTGK